MTSGYTFPARHHLPFQLDLPCSVFPLRSAQTRRQACVRDDVVSHLDAKFESTDRASCDAQGNLRCSAMTRLARGR